MQSELGVIELSLKSLLRKCSGPLWLGWCSKVELYMHQTYVNIGLLVVSCAFSEKLIFLKRIIYF